MEAEITREAAITFALALAAGMVAQSVAHHLRVPGIVLLLAVGVLLGPEVAGVIEPEALGHALQLIVGMSVAVILFEGGLNLSWARLRREAVTIRRLVTVGALVTAAGGSLAARILMGWSWELAVLFGCLVIVTGPTVMTPLLRRIEANENVRTILEGEGVLIDPVGAVIAVVALEVVVGVVAPETGSAATELLGLPSRLVTGTVVGLIGGFALGFVLRFERIVPPGLENVLVLSLLLVLFEASEAIQRESGIMTAAVAGIVVGNMGIQVERELKEFKEQLTVLLIGLLFVLLAATVRLEAVVRLGLPGLATIAVLMFVVRPLNVTVATWGTALNLRERAFLAWLAPRGIVAAAVASLFAQWLAAQGIPGGQELQALVFLVIAVTVVVQGASGRWVANLLGVRRRAPEGWVILGANPVGRALARILRAGGEEVVLVDSNARECEAAERGGFRVVYGDAASERALRQAGAEGRRGLVAATPNQALNLLLVRRIREQLPAGRTSVALDTARSRVGEAEVHGPGDEILFGRRVDLQWWRHELEQGSVDVAPWRWGGEGETTARAVVSLLPDTVETRCLPLGVSRPDGVEPFTDRVRIDPGDVVYFGWLYEHGPSLGKRLGRAGWEPAV